MKQYEKILTLMEMHPEKEWWFAPDFQRAGLGELYVGYEASARISELPKVYPGMFEFKKEGKYRYVRLKNASLLKALNTCPHKQDPLNCLWCKRETNIKNPPKKEGALF
jgi:hypothetical protein